MWLTVGVKIGLVHDKADDYGYSAVEDKVHVHDLHAMILRFLGLEHTKLTYRYASRDFQLRDVQASMVTTAPFIHIQKVEQSGNHHQA